MSVAEQKVDTLRDYLLASSQPGGALLVIYPPEEELLFRSKYDELIQELRAHDIPLDILDFRMLVFETLTSRNLLDKAFQLDAQGSPDARRSLVGMVQKEAFTRICTAAEESPGAILLLKDTMALFPWMSYSALLEALEGEVQNTLIIPFPGTENGPALHFLSVKDGYNYRAARI